MRIDRTLTFAALAIFVSAASPALADNWSVFGHHQERGSGDLTTETRDVADFERIELNCSADLDITIGTSFQVTVTTDDNLQDNIIVEQTGRRTLTIDSEGSYTTHRGVKVEITMPSLSRLDLAGSGDVIITGLKAESFDVELDGSGDIEFDGEIKDLQITIGGSGNVTGHDLVTERVTVETGGSGDVELDGKATEVDCRIDGSGDIDVSRLEAGSASAEINGSGNIGIYAENSFEGAVNGSGDIDLYGDPKDVNRRDGRWGDFRRRH
jgi:hypothetical protein